MPDTLYVHFYGGPGTGKSTTRALTFGALKQMGHNVEEVPEFAKDLTWEKRSHALGFQPYIFGEQAYREERLDGQVEAVLSDTSTLLSLIYLPEILPAYWSAFEDFILEHYCSKPRLNIMLRRDPTRPYNAKGRNQTEEEALKLDNTIELTLRFFNIPFIEIVVDKDTSTHVPTIIDHITEVLGAHA